MPGGGISQCTVNLVKFYSSRMSNFLKCGQKERKKESGKEGEQEGRKGDGRSVPPSAAALPDLKAFRCDPIFYS